MNTIIKTNHLITLKDELDYFSKVGYKLNLDGLWKWASIWKVIKQLGLLEKPFRCVDIGGGLSPLHFIFSSYGEVTNVELAGFKSTWFPTNADGFYIESPGIEHNKNNIRYVQDDFISYAKTIPDNSIDFFYDGCSLIHFNPQKRFSHNDGVSTAMREVTRALKPGGYFISASHVAHPDALEVRDMIHPWHLGECFTSSGLQYITKVDWELEPFFMDKTNIHYPDPSAQPFLHQTPVACTTCRGLPEYHCLYHGNFRGTIVVSCLYTLQKPDYALWRWQLQRMSQKVKHRSWRVQRISSGVKQRLKRVFAKYASILALRE